jgi:two-component system cell cycle sensor histidine kinase/response regulator CckA
MAKKPTYDELEKRVKELEKEIHEHKQNQEALKETEERYRDLIENAHDLIQSVRPDGSFVFVNRAWLETLGYSEEELPTLNLFDIIHPDSLQHCQEVFSKVMAGQRVHDFQATLVCKNGKVLYIEGSASPRIIEGKVLATHAILRDISERRMAQEALRESEERFRAIFEHAAIGVALVETQTGRFLKVNQKFCDIVGCKQEEMSRMTLMEITHPDDLQASLDRVERLKRGEILDSALEKRYMRKDGSIVWVSLTTSPVGAVGERPDFNIAVVEDITARKQVEAELRESEEKYRNILENMEEGYYEVDLAGNLTFFNDSLLRIRGYSKDELKGMNYSEYMDESTAKKVYQVFNKVYSTGEPVKGFEWKITRMDGTTGYVETSISLVKDSTGEPTGFRGVVRDVTERKLVEEERNRLETQLQQARKMEAIGLLAGGVAHDLNNILSGIVGYPDLLLLDLPKDSPIRQPIEVIKESGQRAADVVSDLLTVARGVASSKEVSNLNFLVQEYLGSPEHKRLESMRPSIAFETVLEPELLNIGCSPVHIKKTLMNLVTNASEAIEGMGTVRISTMNRYLDEPLKGYEDVRIGEYALLSVSDDGTGISREDLERIFEPFYTKKVMGRRGTGLGLTVVWNTVQDHGGYINVSSSEKGTTFELYFPTTREEAAAVKQEVPVEDYLGHGEKVLVVDDEQRQREIACGLLSKLGYTAEAV